LIFGKDSRNLNNMFEFIVVIGIASLFGWWCNKIATSNGRDPTLAFIMGFLFGIAAVIIYAIIGQTPAQRLKEARELLKEEKVINQNKTDN
jgi:heme A synthase